HQRGPAELQPDPGAGAGVRPAGVRGRGRRLRLVEAPPQCDRLTEAATTAISPAAPDVRGGRFHFKTAAGRPPARPTSGASGAKSPPGAGRSRPARTMLTAVATPPTAPTSG